MTKKRNSIIRLFVTILAVFSAGAGGVAFASHQFPDSPTGSFFHDAIGAIGEAGCAQGFADGTFRETNPTTRGQFAFWMNNCGGRVAHDSDFADVGDGLTHTVVSTSITAGAAGSGGGFALVQLNVRGLAADCLDDTFVVGCQVRVDLETKYSIEPTFTASDSVTVDLTAPSVSPGANSDANGSVAIVLQLQAGDILQARAVAERVTGTGDPRISADLTLMSFPFDGTGAGNPIP